MTDFPSALVLPNGFTTIGGPNSICSITLGVWFPGPTASGAWPSANLAILVPFRISAPIIAVMMWTFNGSTASGNIDIGIYDDKGTKIVSMGSTAQSGTNSIQTFDITDTQIGPGLFYLATVMNNTTGTMYRGNPTTPIARVVGMAQMASAFPLPNTVTFATITSAYIPFSGLSTRAVV